MVMRLSAARFIVVVCFGSLLLELQAVRHDEPGHEQQLGLAQSNSSLEKLTIDDCNALMMTVFASNEEAEKEDVLLIIRGALFEQNGMAVLADFMTDGLYTIELDQALKTEGTNIGRNRLSIMKVEHKDFFFSGSFHIGGHNISWLVKENGRFYWHSGEAGSSKLHLGRHALSGSCFMIVGAAFISEIFTPWNPSHFAKDALMIVNSAAVLTGSGKLRINSKVASWVRDKPIKDLKNMFSLNCGEVLKLSVGDVLSAVGPPPKNPPPPEPEAALQASGTRRTKTMQLTLHGV
eukprot:TRINITY_DN2961_c0_g1_i1.p1 TRINITY_DN2961_c0_g1~~TRINITY_DN2961_c0_g1_i1.p1  ORF type:complete len:292 (+),score=38.41 TRINITY_DN2961_c0_g1_i1:106-981(+)